MLFDFNTINTYKETNTFDAEHGLIYGNMFKESYVPYKNYTPYKEKPTNSKEEILLKIMMYDFALNDLNLYLILNPNDQETFEKFKNYSKALKQLTDQYEHNYQVLDLYHDTFEKYSYNSNPWPWEGTHV